MHPFDLYPSRRDEAFLEPEPERLQGWDVPDPLDLALPDPLPALIELDVIRGGTTTGTVFAIRGPAVTVGRYTPATGPVDIDLGVLQEHERIRIGLPHLRVGRDMDGWWIEAMTMYYPTYLNGESLAVGGARLQDGSLLVVGDVQFRVAFTARADRPIGTPRPPGPCLRLKRDGAPSSITVPLNRNEVTIGRSSPHTGAVDVDLSALPDAERVHVGRRHARFWLDGGVWRVAPLGRSPVYLNRGAPIEEPVDLATGDEVGLGNVLFMFVESLPSAGVTARRAVGTGAL